MSLSEYEYINVNECSGAYNYQLGPTITCWWWIIVKMFAWLTLKSILVYSFFPFERSLRILLTTREKERERGKRV